MTNDSLHKMIADMQSKFLEKDDQQSSAKMSNLKKLFAGSKGEPNNEYNDCSNFDDSSWWFVSDTFVQQQLNQHDKQ